MDASPRLNLPYVLRAQAQANVTHNEALRILDALVQPAVLTRTDAAPPADAAEGDVHIVGPQAEGDWAGHSGEVAVCQDGGWSFYPPGEGWLVWSLQDGQLLVFNGGWRPVADRLSVSQLGVNAGADASNRLAVAAEGSLFTHVGGSHRLAINKQAAQDTASLIFKDGWTGLAELGLVGADDFALKVSADGQRFVAALTVDRTTGAVSLPRSALLSAHAVNLYADSGRLAGSGQSGVTVGGFAWPAYLALANGSTATGAGKFVNDNSDYGGSAGALASTVRVLFDTIRDPAARRTGAEFWVAEIVQGSGAAAIKSFRGLTYRQSVGAAPRLRPAALTFHAYLRALDDTILVDQGGPASLVSKNGVDQAGPALVAPADGWVSITIRDMVDARAASGSGPAVPAIYAAAAGQRWQLACPALIGGLTTLDDAVGIVAAGNGWG